MFSGVKLWYEDQLDSIIYYTDQFTAGAWVKGMTALLMTVYTKLFLGDVVVLNVYFVFTFVDLLLGTWYAILTNTWSPKYFLYWIRKLVIYVGIISLFGGLCLTLTITTGTNTGFINWLLLCCVLTEFGSIIKNLKKLGLPLPPVFEAMLFILRKRVNTVIIQGMELDDEESRKKVEIITGTAEEKIPEKETGTISS